MFFEQINWIGKRNYGMKMLCIIMGYKVMPMHYVYKLFDYVIYKWNNIINIDYIKNIIVIHILIYVIIIIE